MSYSVVEYFAEHDGYKCGYCGSKDSNYSHGMWAHQMTNQDYQDLIDRGWRRSGKYVYKPTMNKMCCPSYSIRCEPLKFKLSKSHKKLLKRVTKYMTVKDSGIDKKDRAVDDGGHDEGTSGPSHTKRKDEKNTDAAAAYESLQKDFKKKPTPGAGADPNKPKCRKAKIARMERKMASLGKPSDGGGSSLSQSKETKNEKSLKELLQHVEPGSEAVHKLEIKLVRSSPRSAEFQATFQQAYQVYAKYQTTIHKDPPTKCTEKQIKLVRSTPQSEEFKATFKESAKLFAKYQMAIHKDPPDECDKVQYTRFLVDSPLEEEHPTDGPDHGYGSFHQQYWLDGKIIAVGVIDILPNCVSSVYLYYDPDYGFLSPGTYSALQEIEFTQQLHQVSPAMQYYYMGFYIHSCPKMKYKGNYFPSFLLCPEVYTWVPIEKCRSKLDASNYARLEETDKEDDKANVSEIMVLHQRQAMPYMIYRALKPNKNDTEEVQEYAEFVGKKCGRSMLLYRA